VSSFESDCEDHPSPAIEVVIRARPRDIGGFFVRRSLPSMRRRMVGPWIFFDHMGPAEFDPGQGMDVRPHPHISLATVTYLFEGAILHRDSLGNEVVIHPGDVNWMIAGNGITHSERTPPSLRAAGHRSHGLQAWVALRTEEEEIAPAFVHHSANELPVVKRTGLTLRVISGSAYGVKAPTPMSTPTLYVDARLEAGVKLEIPSDYEQRALYVVSGSIRCEGGTFDSGTMLVLSPQAKVELTATDASHVMILGGAPVDGERFIWWNFVSSSKDRLERAKADWKAGRFPKVVGDDAEFIPLPE
jgi:redox-sensitive bicupin YhaK (pirin superfamily)